MYKLSLKKTKTDEYELPNVDIDPLLLLDENNNVYRISIGTSDLAATDKEKIELVIEELRKKAVSNFIENVYIYNDCMLLSMNLVYVEITNKDFGIFCELESLISNVTFTELKRKDDRSRDADNTKDKKTRRTRSNTDKK